MTSKSPSKNFHCAPLSDSTIRLRVIDWAINAKEQQMWQHKQKVFAIRQDEPAGKATVPICHAAYD